MSELNRDEGLIPRVIVCLDVANGRVVKGVNFKGLVDMGDPVDLALKYQEQGADEIVFLDIKATLENRANALDTVTRVAKNLSIPFTVGGGLNSYTDVAQFLAAGADKVALNSAAIKNPSLINEIAEGFGSQCVVVAIDVNKDEHDDYAVYVSGGHVKTDVNAFDWFEEVEQRGAGEILLTAMHRDGTGIGFDNELMSRVAFERGIQVIASGGASNAQHFVDTYIAGSDAALAAGMFHRAEYSVNDVKQVLKSQNILTR
ncbi:imidazole glycerol phosphate synthase subunit HisF [Kangiella sediminilitoris]|uniref:Imidazole glycerol phosphate synthase subunit HisF n=1 Tax=Kangiella sediminilitoris TaxID=1144748 RepID=A0A1B3BBR1_9GAMM|nr:imidazole glycerol phosphate synthase subunit HisF [Kangiella sediminilitoris]AOE50230.1 Imidazole glycerol phosphate synthase subunit HisF [Kangiella sediminilitoris]